MADCAALRRCRTLQVEVDGLVERGRLRGDEFLSAFGETGLWCDV